MLMIIFNVQQGQTINLSLNEKGKQDAYLAGKAFCGRFYSLSLSSDLTRARQTAEIIDSVSKEHYYKSANVSTSASGNASSVGIGTGIGVGGAIPSDIPHVTYPELREVNYGVR